MPQIESIGLSEPAAMIAPAQASESTKSDRAIGPELASDHDGFKVSERAILSTGSKSEPMTQMRPIDLNDLARRIK
jgi:hypothetical protein